MTGAPEHRLVDLREVLDTSAVRELLAAVSSRPIDELIDEHGQRQRTRVALGLVDDGGIRAAILARTPHAGVCEILALGPPEAHFVDPLLDAAADTLHAVAIWGGGDSSTAGLWHELGFSTRPDPSGDGRIRAERRHPPEPDGFHTEPVVRLPSERRIEVDLPPEGNTLPLVPGPLRDHPVPAHVVAWLLDADEVGLLLQELAPDHFPPVTPAVRPASVRSALGSLAAVLGDPALDDLGPDDLVPGLPQGLQIPTRVVELLAAADRIRTWLVEARRVRAWAERHGHADATWMMHDPWSPHDDVVPEHHREARVPDGGAG